MRPPMSKRGLTVVAGAVVGGALVLGAVQFTDESATPVAQRVARPEPQAVLV
ncbi:DUF2613 family protein, partial [Actinomadura sediminis]